MSCEKCDLPRCGTMREIDRLRERVSRLERERDEAQYAAGAWEAMALVRMTPAEHAESRVWVEINARECARTRQVA